MRDGGTLWNFIPADVVKHAQSLKWRKKSFWTGPEKRTIIGFTKEVTFYGRPLKMTLTAVVLLIAVSMDFSFYRIRNELIFAGITAGIALWIPTISIQSSGSLLAGVLLPVVICWIPFRMHGLGAGDVKLFSVIGCLNGGRDVVYCICFSFLLAAGISLGRLLSRRQLISSLLKCFQYFQEIVTKGKLTPYPGKDDSDHRFHFSISILFGYLILLGVKVCEIVPLFSEALRVAI